MLSLLLGVAGFHFQSLVKNTNEIKRTVRRAKTAVTALIDASHDRLPTQEEFDAVLPGLPRPLLGKRLGLRWTCYQRSFKRGGLRTSYRVRLLATATGDRCIAALRRFGAKCPIRLSGDTFLHLPPKLYRYETSYASLERAPEQGLTVDDVQLDWRAAPDAREAVRLCGVDFAVDTETDARPGLEPIGTPGNDFHVFTSERCIIWARPMTRRFGRRPR